MDTITIILIVLLFIIIIGILGIAGFTAFNPFSPPLPPQTFLNPDVGSTRDQQCLVNKISCVDDSDCNVCIEGLSQSLKCVPLNYTPDQSRLIGQSGKYCLPERPIDVPCNSKNGGIWAWTGYSGTESMGWDCLCTYPDYFNGPGCNTLNSGICSGGTFNYDASTAETAPTVYNCNCPSGSVRIRRDGMTTPICVPSGLSTYYNNDIIV